MLKRGILTLLVLLLVVCGCAGALVTAGVVIARNQNNVLLPLNAPTQAAPTAIPAQPSAQSSEISADVSQQMDQIQNQVSLIRKLTLLHSFKRTILTSDQLQQKAKDVLLKYYSPQQAADDVALYSTLGLLKPDTDLISIYENIYSQQNAGYYAPDNQSMYVIQGSPFTDQERMAYAHEFTHALQDQHYDLFGRMKITGNSCRNHSETCLAVTALVEGDAVSTEQDWLYSPASNLDRTKVQGSYLPYRGSIFDSSPEFIKEDLLFPYHKGFEFVQTLYDQGGWQAVDKAFENLPVSTAQIMHPDLYPDHKPVIVTLPDLEPVLGSNWRQLSRGSLGEWYTYLVLSHGWQPSMSLPEPQGQQAAAGWSGDSYTLYQQIDDPKIRVLVVEWKWGSLNDSNEFWNALATLCKERWGNPAQESVLDMKWAAKNGDSVSIQYTNQGTRWIIASNQAVFDKTRAAFK